MTWWQQALGIVLVMWATIGLGYVGLSYALLWEKIKADVAAGGRPPEWIFKSKSRWVVAGAVAFSIAAGVICGPLSVFVWRLNFRPYD
jgi:hypothetical protein